MISTVLNNKTKHNISKKLMSVFSICLLAISAIDVAGAANYYVSTTGSDSRTLAQAQNSATPWKTIQKAADNVSPGSIVHVAPGTYSSLTTINKSGTSSARLTFISDTKWGAKIRAASNEALIRVNGSYIDIRNFEIIGSGNVKEGILVSGSNVQVVNNKIHEITGSGVMTWKSNYAFSNIDIVGNLIYNIGRISHNHGIYVTHKGGSVSNNIVHHAAGFGIHAWHAANAIKFSNNLVYMCGDGGLTIGAGDDPYGVVADNFVVTNNISAFNGKYGITENGFSGKNNIYRNNIVYGNGWAGFDLLNGNTAQNTRAVNPQLVNFKLDGTGDHHLSSTSPAINAGTTLGAPSIDFDGAVRTGTPDIGPYEK